MRYLIFLTTALLTLGFSYKADAQRAANPPRDGIYNRKDEKEKPIINYEFIREADVIWRKRIWRVIDVREKMNLPFSSPQLPFISILIKGINSGELKAYAVDNDSFTIDLGKAALDQAIGGGVDTVDRPKEDGTTEKVVVTRTFDPKSVKRFRLKEDWVFDKETSTMQVRILGICPIREDIDDQGNSRGDKPMFWMYYPDCRKYLAQISAFNEQNDAIHLSWEDLFEQRKFGSYVIKEDNVYDRRIKDYATGIDALLESDRVKNVIFNWEHDVWSF